jgi:hypothetical protein
VLDEFLQALRVPGGTDEELVVGFQVALTEASQASRTCVPNRGMGLIEVL